MPGRIFTGNGEIHKPVLRKIIFDGLVREQCLYGVRIVHIFDIQRIRKGIAVFPE